MQFKIDIYANVKALNSKKNAKEIKSLGIKVIIDFGARIKRMKFQFSINFRARVYDIWHAQNLFMHRIQTNYYYKKCQHVDHFKNIQIITNYGFRLMFGVRTHVFKFAFEKKINTRRHRHHRHTFESC